MEMEMEMEMEMLTDKLTFERSYWLLAVSH